MWPPEQPRGRPDGLQNSIFGKSQTCHHPPTHSSPAHQPPLNDGLVAFDERDGHKRVGGRTDVVQRPILVVLLQQMADALGPVKYRNGAILPVKQFDAVVDLLFPAVDGHFDFNLLLARHGRNRLPRLDSIAIIYN